MLRIRLSGVTRAPPRLRRVTKSNFAPGGNPSGAFLSFFPSSRHPISFFLPTHLLQLLVFLLAHVACLASPFTIHPLTMPQRLLDRYLRVPSPPLAPHPRAFVRTQSIGLIPTSSGRRAPGVVADRQAASKSASRNDAGRTKRRGGGAPTLAAQMLVSERERGEAAGRGTVSRFSKNLLPCLSR